MNHLQGFCFLSLQFCALWIGGLGSKGTNASIRIPNMALLTWKLRLPPRHLPQNQWAKKRVTLLAVVTHPEFPKGKLGTGGRLCLRLGDPLGCVLVLLCSRVNINKHCYS